MPAGVAVLMVRIVPGARLSTIAACSIVSASSIFSNLSYSNLYISRSKTVALRVYSAGIANVGRGRMDAGMAATAATLAAAWMAGWAAIWFMGWLSQSG